MRRRDFITLLGAAAAWPLGARAAAGDPVIGFLGSGAPAANSQAVAALRQGLFEAGYIDTVMARELTARGKRYAGVDVEIEFRWANSQEVLLPRLAADLVRRQPAAIVTQGSSAALAAKAATTTIPILFVTTDDPVKAGLVASLERPGGNISGATSLRSDIAQARLELLLDLAPPASKIGYLAGPSTSAALEDAKSDIVAAGRTLGREIIVVEVRGRDFAAAFASLVAQQAGALMVDGSAPFAEDRNRSTIVALAARHKMPAAMYPARDYAASGGLMSYEADLGALFHEIGYNYVGLVLDRSKLPADLPVKQPNKFQLVLNLKTAKALGLSIPPELRSRATEVIQ